LSERAKPRPLFKRYWRDYLSAQWRTLVLVLVLLSLDGATMGALSKLIQPLFDKVFVPGGETAILMVGLLFLGLFVLRAMVSSAARTLTASVTQRIAARMQSDLLRHLLKMDMGFFQAHAPGTLIERVQGDTLAAQAIWSNLLSGLGRDGLGVLILIAVALSIDVRWTMVTLVGLPFLIIPVLAIQGYIRRKAIHLRNQAGLRATRLDEIFHGIQSVKLNGLEEQQLQRFSQLLHIIRRVEIRLALSRSLVPALLDVTTGLGFFAVLLVAGPDVAAGERTAGEFMSFFTAVALIFQPLRRLGELSGGWQVAAASLERIYELIDHSIANPRPPRAEGAPSPDPKGDITFEDVHFAHGERAVLQGLSFTARAGKTTALVGASGAGKSTVFHLLTGLYDPASGSMTLAGLPLNSLLLAQQRGLFTTVTQESALFDETLRENIRPGAQSADDADLDTALDLAHVSEFLGRLSDGLDTPVGPRGSALSGGQRQRVAIARALLRAAPILLLDEATSALDTQSEAAVSDALRGGAAGRTTIVIAHRLSTIRDADHIIVLDQGRVAEEGNHESLLAKGGLYAQLHEMQFKD
jgi:subfamily B ATP-binding cassette protein MsbA